MQGWGCAARSGVRERGGRAPARLLCLPIAPRPGNSPWKRAPASGGRRGERQRRGAGASETGTPGETRREPETREPRPSPPRAAPMEGSSPRAPALARPHGTLRPPRPRGEGGGRLEGGERAAGAWPGRGRERRPRRAETKSPRPLRRIPGAADAGSRGRAGSPRLRRGGGAALCAPRSAAPCAAAASSASRAPARQVRGSSAEGSVPTLLRPPAPRSSRRSPP